MRFRGLRPYTTTVIQYLVPGSENEKVLHLNRRGQIAQFWCASSAVPVPRRYDLQMKKAASHYEKSGYM